MQGEVGGAQGKAIWWRRAIASLATAGQWLRRAGRRDALGATLGSEDRQVLELLVCAGTARLDREIVAQALHRTDADVDRVVDRLGRAGLLDRQSDPAGQGLALSARGREVAVVQDIAADDQTSLWLSDALATVAYRRKSSWMS